MFEYLPIDECHSNKGLLLTGVGKSTTEPLCHYPRDKHPELYSFAWASGRVLPEYQFVLISNGYGEFESESAGLLCVESGTVLVVHPNSWHRYRPNFHSGWTEHWISVSGRALNRLQPELMTYIESPLIKLKNLEAVRTQYQNILDLVDQRTEHSSLAFKAKSWKLILDILSLDQKYLSTDCLMQQKPLNDISLPQDREDRIIENAKRIIWNDPHQNISVSLIAKKLEMSRRTLENHFNQKHDRGVLKELIACRLNRAQRLLVDTHLPIKQIAYASGFSNASHLCHVFKRELGMTPSQLRASEKNSIISRC